MPTRKVIQKVFLVFGAFTLVLALLIIYFSYSQGFDQNNSQYIGKMCGGIAGNTCPAGLRCVYKDNFPDATGTCQIGIPSMNSLVQQIKPQKPARDNSATQNEMIYSVASLISTPGARGNEVKVKGIADFQPNVCTFSLPPQCNGEVIIRDKSDTDKKNVIAGLNIEGSTEELTCRGSDQEMVCNGPLEIGQEYVFTGVLTGEVRNNTNGEPYILNKFTIKSYISSE